MSSVLSCTTDEVRGISDETSMVSWELSAIDQLINSFPLTYGMWTCDLEKLSTSLEADHQAQSSEIFLSFQPKKLKEL